MMSMRRYAYAMALVLPLMGMAACGDDGAEGDGTSVSALGRRKPTPTPSPTSAPTPAPSPSPTSTLPASGLLPLTGSTTSVHDPAILRDDDGRYLLFTYGSNNEPDGMGALRSSSDLLHWTLHGGTIATLPAWTQTAVPGSFGVWSPDIVKRGGTYRLYYAVSTFGSQRSAIALATNTRIDTANPSAGWVDQGPVIQSNYGDDYNAIDPAVFTDATGREWMMLGSFWTGIKMIELDPATGMRKAGDTMRSIAARPNADPSIEAPYVIQRDGYYYLFVSFDYCCRSVDSTYRTVVGRSTSPTGPYVDRAGVPMLEGGGTPVLNNNQGTGARYVGRGHVSVLKNTDGRYYIFYHTYDTQLDAPWGGRGRPTLEVQPLIWSADGWPSVTG